MSSGYVYILWNPSYRRNQFKIGKTARHPELRAQELSASTSTPQPFEAVYWIHVRDCDEAERLIHRRLSDKRIAANREFFEIKLPDAIAAMQEIENKVGREEKRDEEEEWDGWLAPVAALGDVMRQSRRHHPCQSRHAGSMTRGIPLVDN